MLRPVMRDLHFQGEHLHLQLSEMKDPEFGYCENEKMAMCKCDDCAEHMF
jgi:hypothetical protein